MTSSKQKTTHHLSEKDSRSSAYGVLAATTTAAKVKSRALRPILTTNLHALRFALAEQDFLWVPRSLNRNSNPRRENFPGNCAGLVISSPQRSHLSFGPILASEVFGAFGNTEYGIRNTFCTRSHLHAETQILFWVFAVAEVNGD